MAAADQTLVNPLHPSVADKLDPLFAELYTRYQAPRLRADQVPYEVWAANPSDYGYLAKEAGTLGPYPATASDAIRKVPVTNPDGEVDIQIFVPTAEAIAEGGLEKDGKLPVAIWWHGGGFVIGDLKADESWCRQACQRVGCVVVNADYRTAPEHPHPTSAEDAWAVVKWVVANAEELKVDTSRIAVAGSSAGGCLAAVASLLARDEPDFPDLALQILVVPVIDARYMPIEGPADPSVPYKSYIDLEFAPFLPLARLRWFYNYWLGTDDKRAAKAADFRASPIVAESLANLPFASFHVAEVDPLNSEAAAYRDKLTEAGTPCEYKVYKGVGHVFPQWDGKLPAAKEYMENCITDLKKAFSK